MKKLVLGVSIVIGTLTASLAYSASGQLDSQIDAINSEIVAVSNSVSLSSAPTTGSGMVLNNIIYTPWELIHRAPMMQGFLWTGSITSFITPEMYIGTPFGSGSIEASSYADCVKKEYFLSFGLGQRIKKTDIAEMRSIAKSCAKTFYGKYFEGKPYTTREEFLMSMFTVFGENISFSGSFTERGSYTPSGSGVVSGYNNVPPQSWYAPYVKRARELGMVETSLSWNTATAVTDSDIVDMVANYTAYRMSFSGNTLEKGIILTDTNQYYITFIDDKHLTLRIR